MIRNSLRSSEGGVGLVKNGKIIYLFIPSMVLLPPTTLLFMRVFLNTSPSIAKKIFFGRSHQVGTKIQSFPRNAKAGALHIHSVVLGINHFHITYETFIESSICRKLQISFHLL